MERLTKLANKIGRIDKGTEFLEAHGFTEFYQPYFEKILNRAISEKRKVYILEIGVWEGSSLHLYNEFFGPENCELYGLDIEPGYSQYHADNVHLFRTDQDSIDLLKETAKNFGDIKFDIIIDDGGHRYNQQLNTLLAYHNLVRTDGIYIIEDLHTNIDRTWGDFEDSPLNYLITKKKSNFISVEQYLELNDIIKCATIFRRTNEKGSCEKASITSILKVN